MNHQRQRQWRTESVSQLFRERISDTAQTQTALFFPSLSQTVGIVRQRRAQQKERMRKKLSAVSQTKSIFVSRCSHTTISTISSSLTKSQQKEQVTFLPLSGQQQTNKQTQAILPLSALSLQANLFTVKAEASAAAESLELKSIP